MSNILILGYSQIVQKRVIPTLESIHEFKAIEIASKSKLPLKIGKVTHIYSDYIEALNKFDGNLVYISLHNSMHDKYIIESLKRGLNCIVDKPAILNFETIDIIKSITEEKNCTVIESIVYNYHTAWDSLIHELGGNENIFHINSCFKIPDLDKKNFRMNAELGGGAHNDMSSYSISVGRHLWKRNPEKISVTNVFMDDNLVKGFNVSIDYGENKTLKGEYGFGFEYKNNISMQSNNGECGYDRVFSPPSDYGIDLVGTINGKHFEKNNIIDDTFYNFLCHFVDMPLKDNYSYWLDKTFDSFNDLQMLKKAIDIKRRS